MGLQSLSADRKIEERCECGRPILHDTHQSGFLIRDYRLVKDIAVFDIPVAELPSVNPDLIRYVHILEDSGIHTTSEMTNGISLL